MVTVRLDIKPPASDTSVRPTGETLPAGGELSPAQEAVETLTGTKGGFQKKILEGTPLSPLPTFLPKCYERVKNLIICFYLATEFFFLKLLIREDSLFVQLIKFHIQNHSELKFLRTLTGAIKRTVLAAMLPMLFPPSKTMA